MQVLLHSLIQYVVKCLPLHLATGSAGFTRLHFALNTKDMMLNKPRSRNLQRKVLIAKIVALSFFCHQIINVLPVAFALFVYYLRKPVNIIEVNNTTLARFGFLHIDLANNDEISMAMKQHPEQQWSPPLIVEPFYIHQVYKDEEIPNKWNSSMQTVKKYCQYYGSVGTCRYKFWTDATMRQFISTNYPWFIECYDNYPLAIQRVDAFRYFVLYHYGGLYMDLDIGLTRSPRFFAHYSATIPLTNPFGLTNDLMMSRRHHPFFKQLMENLAAWNKWYFTPYFTVLISTGPLFVTIQYALATIKTVSDISLLDTSVYAYSYPNIPKNGFFFFHVPGSSWHSLDAKLIQTIVQYKFATFVIIFILFLYLCRFRKNISRNHRFSVVKLLPNNVRMFYTSLKNFLKLKN